MFEENESGVVIKEDNDKDSVITIEVGSEATRSDFISAWDHIVKKRGKMVRKSVREKAPRDLRIFELHREGKTIREIDTTIKSEYGEDLDYGHIKKTVSSIYSRHHTPQKMRQELLT